MSISRSDIGVSIEAAPNSSTGSGRPAFPTDDGDRVSGRVPETSPCHGLARQDGELDPGGDVTKKAGLRRIESGARRGRPSPKRIGSVRCRLKSWAASKVLQFVQRPSLKSRSAAWGPIQSRRGRACDAWVSLRDRCPISGNTPECVRPFVPQFAVQLPTPGRESFKLIPTCGPP